MPVMPVIVVSVLSTVYSYVLIFVQKEGCYIIAHNTWTVTPTGQCDLYRLGAVHLAGVCECVCEHVVLSLF